MEKLISNLIYLWLLEFNLGNVCQAGPFTSLQIPWDWMCKINIQLIIYYSLPLKVDLNKCHMLSKTVWVCIWFITVGDKIFKLEIIDFSKFVINLIEFKKK